MSPAHSPDKSNTANATNQGQFLGFSASRLEASTVWLSGSVLNSPIFIIFRPLSLEKIAERGYEDNNNDIDHYILVQ